MVDATAEFLKMFRNSEVSGGTMMRNAIGSMTWRYVCASVKPIARPALRWPRGSELMPERTCSHTRAAVKVPRHSIAHRNIAVAGFICLM